MRGPYRQSVWIDVIGVLLIGGVLLGGAGYLLTQASSHAGGAASGGGGALGSTSPPVAQGQEGAGLASRLKGSGSLPPSGSSPRLDRSSSASPGVEAPFSDRWRREATPDLGTPDAEGPSGVSRAAPSPSSPSAGGPAIAEARSYNGDGTGRGYKGTANGSAQANWRAEARQLAGKARALSNQLGQLRQEPASNSEAKSSSKSAGSETAGAAKSASSGPDPPDEPPQVPIDDHLHWLLVAGVLWGAWRIWRGT